MMATSFCVAATGRNYLDADQTAREFWQGKMPTRAPTLSEFQSYMVERIKAYFRGVRSDFWPDTRMVGGEPVLFDIVLFFVEREGSDQSNARTRAVVKALGRRLRRLEERLPAGLSRGERIRLIGDEPDSSDAGGRRLHRRPGGEPGRGLA